ncbi:MAG: hypothetical protein ACK2T3_16645 [Candidatus Promineifilaceae bacterium]
MDQIKQSVPRILAYIFGALALLGLLFLPGLAKILTSWVGFLAAIALLIGILNLTSVHFRRLFKGNLYSLVLLICLLGMVGLGISDYFEVTDNSVSTAFSFVQAPLEAAFASMLAFFLLFSGVRVLQKRRSWWGVLFVVSVIIFLVGRTPLPGKIGRLFTDFSELVSNLFVTSGMRGILIGVAIGAVAVTIRVLMGMERPYDK